MAAPRVCASPATSISRSWRFTTSTEPSSVIMKTTGSSAHPCGAANQKTTRTRPEPMPAPISEPKTDQRASSPASGVPATMPSPKASTKTGTADAGRPPTSVTVGAM